MSRISLLRKELSKRGLTGQVTEEQALDALRALPAPFRHPVPEGFNDRYDFRTELMLMNQQPPALLNLKPSPLSKPPLSDGTMPASSGNAADARLLTGLRFRVRVLSSSFIQMRIQQNLTTHKWHRTSC